MPATSRRQPDADRYERYADAATYFSFTPPLIRHADASFTFTPPAADAAYADITYATLLITIDARYYAGCCCFRAAMPLLMLRRC